MSLFCDWDLDLLSLSSLGVKLFILPALFSLIANLFRFAHSQTLLLIPLDYKPMASQMEECADIGLAGGLGNGGGSSQLHDTKLYTKVAFPSPQPPNDEYQRWKGDPGEQNGHHQYKLEFNIYTGTGNPDPDIGDPSDIYFNLVCSCIFAKLHGNVGIWQSFASLISNIWSWNTCLIQSCTSGPKLMVGVQWYHQDNFKTQRSWHKDNVVEVGELIELTLKYWGNTESKKPNTRGKKRKTKETSTNWSLPHPSPPSGSSQIPGLGAMGAPGALWLVQESNSLHYQSTNSFQFVFKANSQPI